MADHLLKKNLQLLRKNLQLQEIDLDLLSNDVITDGEFQDVAAQNREHGQLQANKALLTVLLRKSADQITCFFECVQREQPDLWERMEHTDVSHAQPDGLVCQESCGKDFQGSAMVAAADHNLLTEKVMSRIATEIAPDWEDVAYELDMTHSEVLTIRRNNHAVQEAAREMLFFLRDRSPSLTMDTLVEALLSLNKRLVADKVERIFSTG